MDQLIQDITILNKVYEDYKNQSIRTLEQYNIIYNKYKDKMHHTNIRTGYAKIIGKFYKYDELTGKFIIPIFYKYENNDNNYYSLFSYHENNIDILFNHIYNDIFSYSKTIVYDYFTRYSVLRNHSIIYMLYSWHVGYSTHTGFSSKTDYIKHLIYHDTNQLSRDAKIKVFNTIEFQYIPFKKQHELEFEKRLQKLELNNLDLINENNLLKNQVRQNEIEIHYLKSINKEKIVKYNYQEIKNRNKQLNQEFKRVYKLISKNIGINLIS